MSELRWRSRLLQTVGKGLLRLWTYFVGQAETPPAANPNPPDAPPWLPPEFWQGSSRPPADWLALLAESQIPIHWVGTSAPLPASFRQTTADAAESAAGAAPPISPLPAAPHYVPAAPGRTDAKFYVSTAPPPRAPLRLIPTPEADDPPMAGTLPPAYPPNVPPDAPPDLAYVPAFPPPTLADPAARAAYEAAAAASDYAAGAAGSPPSAPTDTTAHAQATVLPPIGVEAARPQPRHPAPDYGRGNAAGGAPFPPSAAGDYRQSAPLRATPPAPEYAVASHAADDVSVPPPALDPAPRVASPAFVLASPAAKRLPDVAYTPLPAVSRDSTAAPPNAHPAAVRPAEPAAPHPGQRHTPARPAHSDYTDWPEPTVLAPPPVYAQRQSGAAPLAEELPATSLPPAADKWPALPPLLTADESADAWQEQQRRQRLEREQLGERGYV